MFVLQDFIETNKVLVGSDVRFGRGDEK